MFGNPKLDLFASCINYQIERYISWEPVPKAVAIEVFSIQWNTECCYIFLPFSLLGKEAARIYRDKTKAIVVMPQRPPHPYEKSRKKHNYNTISKKFGTIPGSTKSLPITPKASPTSTPDRLTTQDIINASLCKSACQNYLYYQQIRHVGKNIVRRKT